MRHGNKRTNGIKSCVSGMPEFLDIIEGYKPSVLGITKCCFKREHDAQDDSSKSITAQLNRWFGYLDQWETAGLQGPSSILTVSSVEVSSVLQMTLHLPSAAKTLSRPLSAIMGAFN